MFFFFLSCQPKIHFPASSLCICQIIFLTRTLAILITIIIIIIITTATVYRCTHFGASEVALLVKNLPANAGDWEAGSTPELGRPCGGGHGDPLQYSCLDNAMDRGAWKFHRVRKSQTRLKQLFTHICTHSGPCTDYVHKCNFFYEIDEILQSHIFLKDHRNT